MKKLLQKAVEIKTVVHASLKTLASEEFKNAYTQYSQSTKKALIERNKAISKATKAYKRSVMKSTHKFNTKVGAIYANKKQEIAIKVKQMCHCC